MEAKELAKQEYPINEKLSAVDKINALNERTAFIKGYEANHMLKKAKVFMICSHCNTEFELTFATTSNEKRDIMEKLTKGQKNELIRQDWINREKAINKFGFSIKSRKCGYGELDVSIFKDGINIQPGASWDHVSSAIIYVEELIKNSKEKFYSQENDFTADDIRC